MPPENVDLEDIAIGDMEPDFQAAYYLQLALLAMKGRKPNDRSEIDRHWQIAITDLEKVVAYFDYWVIRAEGSK